MPQKPRFENGIALALIALAVACRVFPHPYNFSPVTATAIFSAAVLPPPVAFTVPLIAMIVSDLWIGPHDLYWLTWGIFALTGFLGLWVRRRQGPGRIVAASLAGSILFFVTTNLGVFLFENLYPKTLDGLKECFWMALPFFGNTAAGDLIYSAVLFGLYAVSQASFARLAGEASKSRL